MVYQPDILDFNWSWLKPNPLNLRENVTRERTIIGNRNYSQGEGREELFDRQ